MRYTKKTVVVTGGTSGIGLAAARAFLAEGARVAVTGRDEKGLQAAPQTSLLEAPLQGMSGLYDIQGTQGQQGALAVQSFNSALDLAVHRMMQSRRYDPKALAELTQPFKLRLNDTTETRERKVKGAIDFMRAQPAPAGDATNPAGLTADEAP